MENRKHPRVPSKLRCWCEGDNVTFYARVGNLSEGGLFLRTSTPLQAGAQTRLRLRNGDPNNEFIAAALVVWANQDTRSGPPGMGLRFEELDEGSREKLKALIDHELGPHVAIE
jgi:uncharacterized protein (TIGR02266 family)